MGLAEPSRMKKQLIQLLVLAGTVFVMAPEATADSSAVTTDPWAHRTISLELNAGLGTPLGFGGVAMELTPVRYVSLVGGVGVGKTGAQVAGMLRLRAPIGRVGIEVGTGISRGAYDGPAGGTFCFDSGCPTYHYDAAKWLNLEFALDYNSVASRMYFRFFGGVGYLLNPTDCSYSDRTKLIGDCSAAPWLENERVPYLGLALGFRLK